MSESSFPFDTQADPVSPIDETEGGSRKPLLLVGGLVGALALGAGAFLLLGGSGADDELALGVPPSLPSAAAPAPAPEEVLVVPAATSEVIGRNPFKAKYVAPVAAPASTETTSTTGSAAGSGTTSSIVITGGSSTGGATSTPPSTPSGGSTFGTSGAPPATEDGKPVRVWIEMNEATLEQLGEFEESGTWKIKVGSGPKAEDLEEFTVKTGDSFGTFFKVLRFEYRAGLPEPRYCAVLQYGDAVITMCDADSLYL